MRIGLATALLASAAWAAPVWAQNTEPPATSDAKSQDSGIAEIVVTAQKRAENVQDVPIAISAFGAETLQERAVGLFEESLVRRGFLGLGRKESLRFSDHAAGFADFVREEKIYQRRDR